MEDVGVLAASTRVPDVTEVFTERADRFNRRALEANIQTEEGWSARAINGVGP